MNSKQGVIVLLGYRKTALPKPSLFMYNKAPTGLHYEFLALRTMNGHSMPKNVTVHHSTTPSILSSVQ